MDTKLEPRTVFKHFNEITTRPHPSANQPDVQGNEDPVRQYVVQYAVEHTKASVVFYDAKATNPGRRVIVLSRPGSGRYASSSPVILQAHMDMVYNPVDMRFPLQVAVEPSHGDGTWIKAHDATASQDCTLGADDGIGVATALALLEDESLRDYPIECLFTVQEETDMGGAQNFDLSNLKGQTLLNLDAEDLKVIIYGAAGGCETKYTKSITREKGSDRVARRVSISKLQGGHSGVDINKGYVNAIKALSQTLVRLNRRLTSLVGSDPGIGSYDLCLSSMRRTDVVKSNAIPAAVEAVVVVPKGDRDAFDRSFKAYCETLKAQSRPAEPNFSFDVADPSTNPGDFLDNASTDATLCMLAQIPTGVLAMIPTVPGVVETSSNLYQVWMAPGESQVEIDSSNRSSNERALHALNTLQSSIGTVQGFEVKTSINSYPSWRPNRNSLALEKAEAVYRRTYGDYSATVIHAGLECGTLVSRFAKEGRQLDCVSLGPTIKNPHTPRETLQILAADQKTQTVQQFYNCVHDLIVALLTN